MMPYLLIVPRPTKNVPMIEETIESAPMTSGNVVALGKVVPSTRCPSSIAAVVVTT